MIEGLAASGGVGAGPVDSVGQLSSSQRQVTASLLSTGIAGMAKGLRVRVECSSSGQSSGGAPSAVTRTMHWPR